MRLGGWVALLVPVFAAACGDSEAPISYTPVSATSEGDFHTLQLGDLKMVVQASRGARITEFSLRGTNVLVTVNENMNYGATYWPSPQSIWCTTGVNCWPPPSVIDNEPYAGGADAANLLHLMSPETSIATVTDSAITVGKHFRPVPESGAIDVSYTLTNSSPTVSIALAPWQVTRVPAGGITFFGQGSGQPTYATDSDPTFMLTEGAGGLWYESATVRHDSKALADGAGWLAHATPERLLYLQSHPDLQPADAAPGEAEIEVFTNSSYVEAEAQADRQRVRGRSVQIVRPMPRAVVGSAVFGAPGGHGTDPHPETRALVRARCPAPA
jgi:hypothetical protein